MLTERFCLTVRVPQAGYRLTPTGEVPLPATVRTMSSNRQRWLVEAAPAPGLGGCLTRQPDDENPLLYRQFAAITPGDHDGIVAFANTWGLLHHGRQLNAAPTQSVDLDDDEAVVANGLDYLESLDLWQHTIRSLAFALRVHQHLKEGDRGALASLLEWKSRSVDLDAVFPNGRPTWLKAGEWRMRIGAETDNPEGAAFLARCSPTRNSGEFHQVTPVALIEQETPDPNDDPRRLAALWLHQRISYEIGSELRGGLQFAFDERTGRSGIEIRPVDLCSLLWFQFARSLAKNTEERACRECGRWFALTARDRDRKFFCSGPCKTKHFRNKKKRAVELHAAGETLQFIVQEVGTDLPTLKKWVRVKVNRIPRSDSKE